ncbi:PadR family transcriptional regulator [Metasolibacillus meyeri]|uniref:PadR family transcriptional regulator n=1 Tax=Metasolibacillus meyeri TaxID=1071052 RepID=UPI000D31058C|nr:PadR family transcriptional regulator [Metasolibacillus meyeri]
MSTRLIILGLLSNQSMTGYEIQQVLQQSGSDKWAGILSGSVYHALKKLEQEAFIKVETIESTGNRQKARFAITEKGEEEVHALVIKQLRKGDLAYPTAIYSAISFLTKVNKEEAIAALEENEQHLLNELQFMSHGRQSKEEANHLTTEMDLIFDNIHKQIELQLDLINNLKKHLT